MNNSAQSIAIGIIWLVRAVFITVSLYYLIQMDWFKLFLALQAFAISFVPFYVKKLFDMFIPYTLQAGLGLFMFGTLFLGEMADFYKTFWWWDILLHGAATVGLTILGFMVLLKSFSRQALKINALISSFLAFSIAMTMAVVWEIYEFLVDEYANRPDMMQPSNTDTMIDLIIGVAGAALVSILGYRYVRWKNKNFVGVVLEECITENKQK